VKRTASGSRGNGSRVEARLRAIVESCGVPAGEREEYVAFARELYLSLRRPPKPDYSMRTKRVVQRFFERGLRAKLLVAIGREIEVWLFGQGR
jgi:hypothetical protein